MMTRTGVTIFAPSPTLTVTVEPHEDGPDVHVHAGGQGVWQARMLLRLGVPATLCCVLTGEVGKILQHLLDDEGVGVAAVHRDGRGSAYVHDRRNGERVLIAETDGDALARHDLDELYGVMLREGIASGLMILSGPAGNATLPSDTYRRLAGDLRAGGTTVVVDLCGTRLASAIEGGVDVLKVSDEELLADRILESKNPSAIIAVMHELHERGADAVIVTRSSDPALLLDGGGVLEVTTPQLEVSDTRGAGDSFTAGVVAAISRGESVHDAVTLGAAAGALNVTRHGLGTGDRGAIEQLRTLVQVREIADQLTSDVQQQATIRVSLDDLAALTAEKDK